MSLKPVKSLHCFFRWAAAVFLLADLAITETVAGAGFARVWQTDDGLLNNNIHAIVQTPDDFLWLSTPVSLMRFDGVSFTPFPVKDYTGTIEASLSTQQAFGVYRGDKMSHALVTLLRAAPGQPWRRIDGLLAADDLLAEYHRLLGAPQGNVASR